MIHVHVLDTSGLIQIKDDLPAKKLWETLRAMEEMVDEGKITFPKQVEKELVVYGVPDSITAWCAAVTPRRQFPDPSLDDLSVVMKNPVVAKVCDWNNPPKSDPADPYVVAQAYVLVGDGVECCVVTEDWKGKKDGNGNYKRSSLQMSCDALSIPCSHTADFLTAVGLD